MKKSKDTFVISNETLTMHLVRNTGRIGKITLGENSFPWSTFQSRLTVKDELTGKEFTEDGEECTVRVLHSSSNAIAFKKRFDASPFVMREDWHTDSKTVAWHLEITGNENISPRSLEVRYRVPWPEKNFGTNLWAASPAFPTQTSQCVGNYIEYGDSNYGINLPLLTLYQTPKDIGLSLAKPLGEKIPRLRFFIPHWYEEGPEVEFSFLGLESGKTIKLDLIFTAHVGCWRPALKWFSDLYPEYFHSPNPDVRKLEGGYVMSHPSLPEEKLKLAKKYGVKWAEIHQHFPVYGNYVPQDDSWPGIMTLENTSHPAAVKISPEVINRHCRQALKHGITPLLYFQCAGDGYIPYVRKKFSDAVGVAPNGQPMPSWINCWLMNSDPVTSFGKHINRQIQTIFERYPAIEGIFLDQLCYNGIDVAHDDGMTRYKNKPAYMLVFCYLEMVKKLAEEVHSRGKVIIANGSYDVEVQRYVDGHMAEGIFRNVDFLKYLCIYKPLLFLAYYKSVEEAELMFQNCLLAGASYNINTDFINHKIKTLLRTYLPLAEKLQGRKWVLEPHPLSLPANTEGNIFETEDGNLLVTLITSRRSIFDRIPVHKNVIVNVTISEASRIRSAHCLGADYHQEKKVTMEHKGSTLHLTLPVHGVASVIVLKK